VDRTPPRIRGLGGEVKQRVARIRGKISDDLSRIALIQYAIDGSEKWNAVLPADSICDSNRESFNFTIEDLEPGSHRIIVRVQDELGNKAFAGCDVEIK
jgi:hypothetical protein